MDLISSVAAHISPGASEDCLGLPTAERYVLVLVDGLGWFNLFDPLSDAPVMQSMASAKLTAAMPTTTATSLTSLTTGVPSTVHGIVGFSFRTRPGFVMSTMAWDDQQSPPEAVQPVPTWFERLPGSSATIVPGVFAGSGMTRAYLRGADLVIIENEHDWAARLTQAAATIATHQLTIVYERSLDHISHLKGWHSPQWHQGLTAVDGFVGALQQALPANACLLVTADHGLVDVPKTHRVFIESEPALVAGVDLIGGESRLRHIYTSDPESVVERYTAWLGSRGTALLKADAIHWFGEIPPSQAVYDRIGDVVVMMKDNWALLTMTRLGEANLVGMHGSWTPQERTVPLLTYMEGEP